MSFVRRPWRVLAPVALLVSVFAAGGVGGGCARCGEKPKEEGDTTTGTSPVEEEAPDGGVAPTTPTTIAEFHPAFASIDPSYMVPSALRVTFTAPAFIGPFPRAAKNDVVFSVSPDIGFTVQLEGPSTALFTPDQALKPGERYEITLKEVGSGSRHVVAAEGQAPKHVFTVPPFQFERGQLSDYDERKKKATVDLVFSAPVAKSVGNVKATAGGAAATAKCKTEKNIVRCVVESGLLDKAKTVEVRVDGVSDATGKHTAQARAEVDLPRGKEMRILSAGVREQPSGFVIDVVCTDDASGEPERYHWDELSSQSYELSPRCVLDEGSVERVSVSGNKMVSMSGTNTGFRVFADMTRGSVTLRIDAGARTIDNAVLKETFERTFTVPARKPKVEIVASGRYLPRSAWQALALRHTNVDTAVVQVRHVPPENLVFWMTGAEPADERTSNVIYTANLALKGEADVPSTTWIDVSSWLPKTTRGIIDITVRNQGPHSSDSKRLLLTDLNLVAKRDADGKIHAWALGIEDGKLVSGVSIKSVSPSGRVVASCTTGADGCTMAAPDKNAVDKTAPVALVAQRGEDLTYLKYDELEAPLAESAVQGVLAANEPPYRVAMFFERGVYRPGETAHLTVIARDKSGAKASEGLPVALELVDPRGRKTRTLVVKPNAAGMATTDFSFSSFADTGEWKVHAKTGDTELASIDVFVEEFVPERMKVTVTPPLAEATSDDDASAKIFAQYLFGGSAQGSPVELSCRFEPVDFAPENGPPGFSYGGWHPSEAPPKGFVAGTARGEIGDDGTTTLSCPEIGKGSRMPSGKLYYDAAVSEAGSGRVTHGDGVMFLHPAKTYIGLKSPQRFAQANKPVSVEGMVVDWAGKPQSENADVKLSLYRVDTEYRWAYDGVRGHWRTFYDERLVLESSQAAKISGGKLSATLTPAGFGRAYVVRVSAGERQTDLVLEGRYWWSGSYGDGDRTPRPDAPAIVPMKMPKSVDVGQSSSVEVDIPFEGRALFALEGDGLFKSEWLDVKPGKMTWSFTVSAVIPNAYVSVFVVKDPHLESKKAFLPERAFSVQGIRVKSKERSLDVAIKAPDDMLPRSTLTIEVQVEPREKASVVVAAVDEGILSLTKFQTPDPVALLYPKRALGVSTYETVGWDVLLPNATSSSTGGDEESGGAGGRVSPVKPVALFSGLIETDASGKATVKLEVPQYRGKLRVMAVASTASRVGSAEKGVIVKEPLVLQTTLPRFMLRGDRAEVPVSITNMSGVAREADVRVVISSIETPGLEESDEARSSTKVRVVGKASHAMNLTVGETEQVAFALEAIAPVGAVRVRVEAKSGDVSVYEELDVPLSVDQPRTRRQKRMELKPGTNDLKPLLAGWLPTTERTNIVVSSSPWADAFTHLQHLARYPYGCIEQTSSSTLPLLYLGQIMPDLVPERFGEGVTVDTMAQAGIDRILSMQTPVGGFAYWPGASQPSFWSTAYATHVLMIAKKRKLEVPQSRIDDAIAYLEHEIAHTYETRDAQSGVWDGESYAHYVLALAGKGRKARVEKLLGYVKDKPVDWWYARAEAGFLLRAALYAMGDRRVEKDLRAVDTSPIGTKRANDWMFYSDGRRRGLELVILAEQLGLSDATTLAVADSVASYLRDKPSYWYSTQELGWGITGLGMLTKPGGSPKNAKLNVDGKDRKTLGETPALAATRKKDQDPMQLAWFVARASERKNVDVEVAGASSLWAVVASEGIAIGEAQTTGGDGFSISREYLNADGKEVTSVELGETLTVLVKVQNLLSRHVQNVAIVDRLPAGFEIENARLAAKRRGEARPTEGGAPPSDDGNGGSCGDGCGDSCGGGDGSGSGTRSETGGLSIEHMNIRDDRLEVFGTLAANDTGEFKYTVRAVTAGKFSAPPAEAEAMYDPAIWARLGSQPVQVRGPWESFFQ